MTVGTRLEVMTQVLECESCELVQGCTAPVFASAPDNPRIVVVGEAPGEQEDKQGAPFIGPAGRTLRWLLGEAGIDETTVGFVNTVSCWPRGTPTWDHVHACAKNKIDQIQLLNPAYVLPVGKVALKGFKPHLDIKHGRGRPWIEDGRVHFATYHPAAAMRNGNYEEAMLDDLRTFAELLVASDWSAFTPDTCSGCVNREVVWFEDCGLGWCDVHVPDHERDRYRARAALVGQEAS